MLRAHLSRPGYPVALCAVVLSILVVILGAFTRLVDAGLGCPDWPGCYGHLWAPLSDQAISLANQAWPEAPVDHAIIWPEMVHRYVAGLLGLLVMALWIITFRNRRVPGQPIRLPLIIGVVIVLQAAFGAWTVTLKLWPQVVTAHLLGGFTTATLLLVLTLRTSGWQPRGGTGRLPGRGLLVLGGITLVVAVIQVALGGWTSSNYAALACPDFPTCQGFWVPAFNYARGFDLFQTVGPNYLGGQLDGQARAAIHYVHRVGALLLALLTLALAVAAWRTGITRLAGSLAGVLIVQLVLGILNVYLALPLWAATAHNGVALLLVFTLVTLIYRIYRERAYAL